MSNNEIIIGATGQKVKRVIDNSTNKSIPTNHYVFQDNVFFKIKSSGSTFFGIQEEHFDNGKVLVWGTENEYHAKKLVDINDLEFVSCKPKRNPQREIQELFSFYKDKSFVNLLSKQELLNAIIEIYDKKIDCPIGIFLKNKNDEKRELLSII